MSNDIKLGTIPTLSIGKVVSILGDMYSNTIMGGIPLKKIPSVMLWGPPGVGKSQGIRQLADYIMSETGKKTIITDVRLLLFNPIDLRGIPTANVDKTLAIWLKPQIFQMDQSDDIINILFLDEISSAPQSVQAAAYQITLDRVIGEHKLPDNCIVIAAGNRITDKSVAFKMPKALANRLMHLEIENSFTSWKEWAIKANIHPMVLGFLDFRRDYLNQFSTGDDSLAFATPRSWEMVSNLLHILGDNIEEIYSLVAGLVGIGTTIEFQSWQKVFQELPSVKEIFAGKGGYVPKKPDALYALISSMTDYASKNRYDLLQMENSISYAFQLPPDFAATLFKNYMYFEDDYKKVLMTIPAFSKWMSQKGYLLNG